MAASVEHGLNNNASIPPLESGDRLTRHEFERRYTATKAHQQYGSVKG
ncbi:hypothetical protein [Nostoc sp. FACHB-133]|nr:hypothetical protein [Nostoc sp. FACHB-133]